MSVRERREVEEEGWKGRQRGMEGKGESDERKGRGRKMEWDGK